MLLDIRIFGVVTSGSHDLRVLSYSWLDFNDDQSELAFVC